MKHTKPFKWEYQSMPEHKMIYAVERKGRFRGLLWARNRIEAMLKVKQLGLDHSLYGRPILWCDRNGTRSKKNAI